MTMNASVKGERKMRFVCKTTVESGQEFEIDFTEDT